MRSFLDKYLFDIPRDAASDAAAAAAAAAAGGNNQPFYAPFKEQLAPEDIAFIEDRKFPDLKTVFKSARESDKMARSRNVFEKPDPKKIGEWPGWQELGWPDKLDDFKLEPPKLKNGNIPDLPLFEAVRKSAHANKVLPAAAQAIANDLAAVVDERLAAIAAKGAGDAQKLTEALQAEWKTDYDANVQVAMRGMKWAGLSADDSARLEEFMKSAPAITKAFHKIGKALGEAKLIMNETGGGGGLTPESAAAERRKLESDQAWMKIFKDPRHPSHADYVAKRQELIAIEAGGGRRAA